VSQSYIAWELYSAKQTVGLQLCGADDWSSLSSISQWQSIRRRPIVVLINISWRRW